MSLTRDVVAEWFQFGKCMGAKYMFLVIDQHLITKDIFPFYVFADQEIVSQMYKVSSIYGDRSLIYIADLGSDFDSMIAAALNNFSVGIEN